ncbi:MAG: extracellular solute-binding protein [Faecalimonas sp.]|nr:extracellular solute-binding protein [Faecalimonas sp.]
MKQRLKKLIALGLAATLAFAIVGCGGSGDDKKTGGSTGNGNKVNQMGEIEGKSWEEILAEMPNELRGTTITVYNWNPLSEYAGGTAVIEDFTSQTGIEVKWVTEDFKTYLSKLTSMVASGEAPDVVRLRDPQVTGIQSLQPTSAAGYDFTDGAWDQWVSDVYTLNGQNYGVALKNSPINSPGMLLYNKSLIEKYDLDDPYTLWKEGKWTYDKFVEVMKDYMAESGADFACSTRDWSEITSIFGVAGPVSFDGTKYVSELGNADFINATQKVADLQNTDHLLARWKADEFDAGKCLFWSGTAVHARRQNAYLATQKEAGNVFAVPYPVVEGQEEYSLYQEVEAYGIPQGAKNAAAVPYFLRYFMDAANYDMDTYFCSAQAFEVYQYCTNIENKLWTTMYDIEWDFYGYSERDAFGAQVKEATGANVVSVLDSTGSSIDIRVETLNGQLERLGK